MRIFTTFLMSILTVFSLTAQNFFDDFESYNVGAALGPQSTTWTTWSGIDGGADDVNVSNTDAYSGTKSLYFASTSATGGPADVVLPFGGVFSTGQFSFDAWFKVPANKTGYFNFQADAVIGSTWALEVFMLQNGGLECRNNGGTVLLATTFPQGAWFNLKIFINLNTNTWELFVNNVSQGTFSSNVGQVSMIDFYPADANAAYWVDDVAFTVIPFTLPPVNGAVNNLTISDGLVGQVRNPSVVVKNLGQNAINSFTLNVNYNGNNLNQNVTGVNIPSLGTYTYNYTNTVTLAPGPLTATATISNVNGAGADGDPSDDVKSITINPVAPAAGKVVVGEEGTGTWCQWCPRGAVFMDMMNTKYAGFFAPIAVHNNDPMVVAPYDSAIGTKISGYPSALADRGTSFDPSNLEPQFLQRIVQEPKGWVINGADFNTTTRLLKVSLKIIAAQAIPGSYRMACVLTEDGVKGTSSAWAQSNAYSGGGNGVMGGYELLPNPVPASQMVYDHVARAISPGWAGIPTAFGSGLAVGDTAIFNFEFTLPAGWNVDKMHIVGMIIVNTGRFENAGFSTVNEAILNGWVDGNSGVGVEVFSGPDHGGLWPNPASDISYVDVNLNEAADVSLEILDMNGKLIAARNYGKISGTVQLPIILNELSDGLYLVKMKAGNEQKVFKLIVKK